MVAGIPHQANCALCELESFRITLNPCGFIHKNYNGAPVRAEVSHLESLKEGVGNEIPYALLFVLMRFPITVLMESA